MNHAGRDLLVLSSKISLTPQQLEKELQSLHELLQRVESSRQFYTANEIINLNNYRVIRQSRAIEQLMQQVDIRPFVFLRNKN